jgi:hypothetical protein
MLVNDPANASVHVRGATAKPGDVLQERPTDQSTSHPPLAAVRKRL